MESGLIRLRAPRPPAAADADASAAQEVPHPRRRWVARILVPTVILAAYAGLMLYLAAGSLIPATAVEVVPVIQKVGNESAAAGTVAFQAPGWIEPEPGAIGVASLTDGIVETVRVLPGQAVKAGDVIATLIDLDARLTLRNAEAELTVAEARSATARAALREAEQNWQHPIELQRRVESAQAQLDERRADLARWPAELQREEAQAAYLQAEYERIVRLANLGQASEIELVQARQAHLAQQASAESERRREAVLTAQMRALEAEVRAATRQLELRIADKRAVDTTKAMLAEAEGAAASAATRRDEAALRLERTIVKSPSDGVVLTRLVEPGAKLMLLMDEPRSSMVARLYDPSRLRVRVDIPLAEVARVSIGQRCEVISDVLPDRTFAGVVARVLHEADVQKNTLAVHVTLDAPSAELRPEMLAKVRFVAAAQAGGGATASNGSGSQNVLVPANAIVERDGRSIVWVADQPSGTARSVVVTRGAASNGHALITSGLQLGDRVIVNAPPNLKNGDRVTAREAGAEQAAEPSANPASARGADHGTH
ncbi:MAG: efflux RND transporter periplasmic adaptor subunit [Phycisphaerae bacterium]